MGGRVGGWVGMVEVQSKLLVWDTMDQDEERGVADRRKGGQDDPPGTLEYLAALVFPRPSLFQSWIQEFPLP